MTVEPTLGVSTIIDVYHNLIELGLTPSDLRDAVGVTEEELYDPDTRIPASRLSDLWKAAQEQSNNPAIGLTVGLQVKPENLSIVAQAFFQSENLRRGIDQYIRFFRLVNESIEVLFTQDAKYAKIRFKVDPAYYHPSEMERSLVSAVARAHYFIAKEIKPSRVNFQHDEPDYADCYEDAFKTDVRFGQDETSIEFENKYLDYASKIRNPYLFKAVTSHAESLLKKLQPKSSIKEQVEDFIRTHLSQEKLDVEMAAKHLNMTRHTLYRKLKKHDLSFQSMVESIRKEEASKLLKNNSLSISEVAFLLGFSELSAFSRAFKRWTGTSPAQFRQE